jgi:hypothetical protein
VRGWKVVWASALAWQLLGARAVFAQFESDPEETCRTIHAFDRDPSPDRLRAALKRLGTQGRTSLDLGVFVPSELAAIFSREKNFAEAPPGAPAPSPGTQWTLTADVARTLAGSSKASDVRALALDHDVLTVKTARILASSPNLGAVTSLSLWDTGLTAAVLRELLAPGAFPALATLDLSGNRLRPADLRELAARLAERKVRRLVLGRHADWTGLRQGDPPGRPMLSRSSEAAAALAQVAATPSLTALDLSDEPLGLAELEALFQVSRPGSLEIATAAPFGRFPQRQLQALAALDPQGRITLSIEDLTTSPAALRALDRSGLLARTVALAVTCGDACARVLARSTNTTGLRDLELDCDQNAPFTVKAAEALSRAAGLPALRKLGIGADVEICEQGGIGIDGLHALLRAPFVSQLESLRLEDQGLGDAGLLELAKAKNLGALKELAASEWEPFLTPEVARSLLRDGPLASHLEVLRVASEGQVPIANLVGPFDAPRLRVFQVGPTDGSPEDWRRFVRAAWVDRLQILSTAMVRLDESDPGPDDLAKILRKKMAPDACFF